MLASMLRNSALTVSGCFFARCRSGWPSRALSSSTCLDSTLTKCVRPSRRARSKTDNLSDGSTLLGSAPSDNRNSTTSMCPDSAAEHIALNNFGSVEGRDRAEFTRILTTSRCPFVAAKKMGERDCASSDSTSTSRYVAKNSTTPTCPFSAA
ncbi:hypothetical protein B0T16DRAFT_416852 [Cercophora newfieldiana]|uniref:Uncharacterized protein n=1 Tax=Cercophora newfieldiana TaxID=92897 RepID=A0AA39Y2H1_9PEZI|nr:hypothetical protein B0T16DRAFT_416852 [Cercophora newfieldiana]